MISVIIPVYNTEQYLPRCIDSVLASAYQEFEILLVNDGSTDHSPDICRQYAGKDSRIRLINQKNQGVSAARNRGIDASTGDWIVFLDSDDRISPDFLHMVAQEEYQELGKLLRRTADKGGFVYAAFSENALKGFASVEAGLFGGEERYLDLSSIHVSEDMRGRGIGKALFAAAKDWARSQGAGKLYISAHSAVESQAFYQVMGCAEAKLYHMGHVAAEPYDCQLECEI